MANTQSAKKRIRSSERRRVRNRRYHAGARTFVKNALALLESGKIDEAEKEARLAYSILDKAARKGVVHDRNAGRRKGRLMAKIAAARNA